MSKLKSVVRYSTKKVKRVVWREVVVVGGEVGAGGLVGGLVRG